MNECPTDCPLFSELILESVQREFDDGKRHDKYVPDTRDNWTREQVKRAAKDSAMTLTRGQYKHSQYARRINAQQYTSVMSEPMRALIAECDIQELRDIWIELGRVMVELHEYKGMMMVINNELVDIWELKDRKLWKRIQRIRRWIELHGRYAAYSQPKREMTDNEFLTMVYSEYARDEQWKKMN